MIENLDKLIQMMEELELKSTAEIFKKEIRSMYLLI